MAIFTTACPRNCYSSCSFKVHVENGKVVNIDSHAGNKATPEGVCLKGLSYIERSNSPDRILYPMKRKKKSTEFDRISWDEALDTIANKLTDFKTKYGSHSIFYYAGSGMQGLLNGVAKNFWKMFGGVTTHYGSLCWSAGLEATRLTLGDDIKHNAPWNLANAKLIIVWGKNSAETNIQEMIPIEKAQSNGAKLIVIDPRRSPTSERAELLIQLNPGTDAALALALANELIKNKWIDRNFIDKYVSGFDEFEASVQTWTTAKAAKICGIPEDYIHILASYIGKIKPMTIIAGYGMQRFSNGGQTIRTILALQIITGNIGKTGATWQYADLQGDIFSKTKEPVSYYPSTVDAPFRREVGVGKLAEDMLRLKNPELKMIWVERGNPIAQNPDTNTILKAFRNLEFRVVVEEFMTDTAREANILLPAKNMFEQSDIVTSYWNPYIQLRQKVVEPAGEVKPESEIYYHLARRLVMPADEVAKNIPLPTDKAVDDFLRNELKLFPEITLEKLKDAPMLPPNYQEIAFEDLKFATPSGKIELLSTQAKKMWNVNVLPTYDECAVRPSREFPYYLLSPNTKNSIHSQFNNLKLIKQFAPYPVVFIHPIVAEMKKIKHNDMVKIYNNQGYFKLRASLNFSLHEQCVVITNGWWISQGGTPNFLSTCRETDMGNGTAFHDVCVNIEKI